MCRCRRQGDKLHLAAGELNKVRHPARRMQDHIGIADRLNLAAVRTCRVIACFCDDMQVRPLIPLWLTALQFGQHFHHKRICAGLVTLYDPGSRFAGDDPVLQPTPARGRQGPDAMSDAVQIKGKTAVMERKPVLDGGAQPLCQNRCETAGRDCHDHRIAIDNRAKIETAQRRLVRHIHRHPHGAGAARQTFIKRRVTCLYEDQWTSGEQARRQIKRHASDVPHPRQVKRRRHCPATGHKVGQRGKAGKKPDFRRKPWLAAYHKRPCVAEIDKNGKMPCHMCVLVP